MANMAYYQMKVVGEIPNIQKFFEAMRGEKEYKNNSVGRVLWCSCQGQYTNGELVLTHVRGNLFTTFLEGECCYSATSAMISDIFAVPVRNDIVTLSKELNLKIEIYCEETGFEFQENIIIKRGIIQKSKTVYWAEFYESDFVEDEKYWWDFITNENVVEMGITKENYTDFIVDDKIEVGGFPEWSWHI